MTVIIEYWCKMARLEEKGPRLNSNIKPYTFITDVVESELCAFCVLEHDNEHSAKKKKENLFR